MQERSTLVLPLEAPMVIASLLGFVLITAPLAAQGTKEQIKSDLKDAGKDIGHAGEKVGHAAKTGGKKIGHVAKDSGKAVGKGAKEAGKGIKDAFKKN